MLDSVSRIDARSRALRGTPGISVIEFGHDSIQDHTRGDIRLSPPLSGRYRLVDDVERQVGNTPALQALRQHSCRGDMPARVENDCRRDVGRGPPEGEPFGSAFALEVSSRARGPPKNWGNRSCHFWPTNDRRLG
jgi:hypothetical protein